LKIVIAFIQNDKGKLLITQRSFNSSYGGFWELPGGKIEDDETAENALFRELKEELNIDVQAFNLIDIYKDDAIFYLYHVTTFIGFPQLKSGQINYNWIDNTHIINFKFPPRNENFFKLWHTYLILNSDNT